MSIPIKAATAALALAVFSVSAPVAAAEQDQRIVTKSGGAWFYAGGTEQIYVLDNAADGYGVRAQLRWKSARMSLADLNGVGGGIKHQNLALDENTVVHLRLCYTNNGHNVRCSGWQRGVA
jgi:hypothetical protein